MISPGRGGNRPVLRLAVARDTRPVGRKGETMSAPYHRMLVTAVLLGLLAATGCRVEEEPGPYGLVVDRGYYFDPDYYDTYGHYHPRQYWYYDGHSYLHRDDLPHGEVTHLRVHADHGGAFGHGDVHEDHGGDHGGGDHGGGDHGR
jgi:hypothetical protein